LGKIQGGTFGIGYSAPTGALYNIQGGTVTGTNSGYTTGIASCTPLYVLGVSTADLRVMADYLVSGTNPVSQLPKLIGSMSLVYISGTATFDASHPINSSGILFVDGDLYFQPQAYCTYYGLIYCTGKVYIYDGSFVQGCIVAWQGLKIGQDSNASSEMSMVVYSDSAINAAKAGVGRYREMKSTYRVFSGIPNF
jgi:hypothetical protein